MVLLGSFGWASSFSGLVGAAIGGGTTLAAVLLTQGREAERDRKADERRLRDEKRERLRADYVALALAAEALQYVGKQLAFQFGAETKEQRLERLNTVLSKAVEPVGPPLMRLQLESETGEAVDTYTAVFKAFTGFRFGMEMLQAYPQASNGDEMQQHLQTLETGLPAILGAAKVHLQKLERPIDGEAPQGKAR